MLRTVARVGRSTAPTTRTSTSRSRCRRPPAPPAPLRDPDRRWPPSAVEGSGCRGILAAKSSILPRTRWHEAQSCPAPDTQQHARPVSTCFWDVLWCLGIPAALLELESRTLGMPPAGIFCASFLKQSWQEGVGRNRLAPPWQFRPGAAAGAALAAERLAPRESALAAVFFLCKTKLISSIMDRRQGLRLGFTRTGGRDFSGTRTAGTTEPLAGCRRVFCRSSTSSTCTSTV